MKSTKQAAGRQYLLLGLLAFLAGAGSLPAQTTPPISALQWVTPTNNALITSPTNLPLEVAYYGDTNEIASVNFIAAPYSTGAQPLFVIFLGSLTHGVYNGSNALIYTLHWTNAFNGTWLLSAGALSINGQSLAGAGQIKITILPTHLTVDIATPTNGQVFPVSTPIQITTGARDTQTNIANVDFYDGTNLITVLSNGVVVDPPGEPGLTPGDLAYLYQWTNASPGSHILTAIAIDKAGLSATSAPVNIFVGPMPPPVVRITSPANHAIERAHSNLPLLAYAASPFASITNVAFYDSTTNLGNAFFLGLIAQPGVGTLTPEIPGLQSHYYELPWSNLPPGTHDLYAVATDNGGLTSTSAVITITAVPITPVPTPGPDLVSIVATDPIAIAGTNCWPFLTGTNWLPVATPLTWLTNCGPNDAVFTVRRTGPTTNDITVNYAISGTAINGIDYDSLSGQVTIPSGQNTAMITVIPNADETNSLTKSIVLTVEPSTNVPPDYGFALPRQAEALIVGSLLPPRLLPGGLLPDHSFLVTSPGPDGAWFRIDATTNAVDWFPVCTNQVVNGVILFADPGAGASAMQLYRTVPLENMPSMP